MRSILSTRFATILVRGVKDVCSILDVLVVTFHARLKHCVACFGRFCRSFHLTCILYTKIYMALIFCRRKPAHQRVLELGMPESSRKFISCVRKYLIFYLTLCEEAEDLCTLERAYTCLKADRKVSPSFSLFSRQVYLFAMPMSVNIQS